jgi:acetyl-CoA carboxylase carboxyl transferase subunit alpha
VVVTIIGEGGSGGALAIAVGDRIQMLQYSIYSVISPEGCASILFKSAEPKLVREAAASLRLTAPDLLELGVIDTIVPEPLGGAHADPDQATENLRQFIAGALKDLAGLPPEELVQRRYDKFRGMGIYAEG